MTLPRLFKIAKGYISNALIIRKHSFPHRRLARKLCLAGQCETWGTPRTLRWTIQMPRPRHTPSPLPPLNPASNLQLSSQTRSHGAPTCPLPCPRELRHLQHRIPRGARRRHIHGRSRCRRRGDRIATRQGSATRRRLLAWTHTAAHTRLTTLPMMLLDRFGLPITSKRTQNATCTPGLTGTRSIPGTCRRKPRRRGLLHCHPDHRLQLQLEESSLPNL